jgi:predicted extracellular nuclease
MRITEWAYSAASGEFIEFTNMAADPIDMTGWSFDDDHAVAGAFDLGSFGTVQPGESVVITEAAAAAFRAAWGLSGSVKVIGELGVVTGNNLARNDTINLFDDSGDLVDRLTYGDQSVPGTIRTQNASGQAQCDDIGQDNVAAWQLSVVGDAFGSYAATTGERGTPGAFLDCTPCAADFDGNGIVAVPDIFAFLSAWFAQGPGADFDGDTAIAVPDIFAFLSAWFAGCGT